MATPSQNSVGVTSFSPASTGIGRYVAYGVKWGGAFGTGVELSYSFPGAPYNSASAYFKVGYGQGQHNAWSPFSTAERAGAVSALAVWASVANIKFIEYYDNQNSAGELRFARSNMSDFAHCYYPGADPSAGDGWYSQNWHKSVNATIAKGTYDFATLLHEIGHGLGLKHPFEAPNVLSLAQDNYFTSIMSYTASPWSTPKENFASFYPTTPMYYDLVAIQAMYGRNPSHNAGNTTYAFSSTGTYFMTIDDARGTDKITYTGSAPCTINLNQGNWSSVGQAIKFTSETSSFTVCIGPNTIIENAYGGSGNDKIIGNSSPNRLYGNNGNDRLTGNGGNDFLVGGRGQDILTGNGGADRFDFNSVSESPRGSGRDTITDFRASQHDRIDLSTIDADTSNNPGNDVFKFIGGKGFQGGGGEVRFSGGLVQADIDGNRVADLEIKLNGVSSLSKGDFYL